MITSPPSQKVPEIRIENADAIAATVDESPTPTQQLSNGDLSTKRLLQHSDDESDSTTIPDVATLGKIEHIPLKVHQPNMIDRSSLYLDLPEDAMGQSKNKLNLPRQSIISRQSVEMFLDSLPPNETEFANREIIGAVREMMQGDMGLSKEMSVREKMRTIVRSHRFHLFFIGLVVVDCICVIVQMILDMVHKRVKSKSGETPILTGMDYLAEVVSVAVLSVFLVSIVGHALLLGKVYFKSKLEMFDAVIVITSFVLEILSIVQKHKRKFEEIEVAVITFRFWRIIRIVNAIVITVEKRVYRKLESLKSDIRNIIDENIKMEDDLMQSGDRIHELTRELDEKTKRLDEMTKKFQEFAVDHKRQYMRGNSMIIGLQNELKKKNDENAELRSRIAKLTENGAKLGENT